MDMNIRQKLFLFAFIILTGYGVLGYAVYQNNSKIFTSEQGLAHEEQQVADLLDSIRFHNSTVTKQVALFILPTESTASTPLYAVRRSIFAGINQLRQHVAGNPRQRVDSLAGNVRRDLDFLLLTGDHRNKQRIARPTNDRTARPDQYDVGHIFRMADEIQREENIRIRQKRETAVRHATLFSWLLVVLYMMMTGLAILLSILMGRYWIRDQQSEAEKQNTINFEKIKKYIEMEESISRQEKRFRILIEKNTDMFILSTEEGIILYGSPSITHILGYTREEFENQPATAFIHPDGIQAFIENRAEILKSRGKSTYYRARLRHKNGDWIWCEGIGTNMLHESGINAIVSNFRDISEKKREEEQREFDKNNLNALINSTDDLIWSVDIHLNLITCNEPFKEALELVSGHIIKKGDHVLPPGIRLGQAACYRGFYQKALAGESFKEIRNNGDKWAEVSFYPIRMANEIVGVACHSHDITKSKQIEKKLLQSEKCYRRIVETAQEGIWVLDAQNKTTFVNKKMCEILEYTEEEMIGRTNFSFKDEKGKEIAMAQIERRRQGIGETSETKFITKNGRPIWTQLSANPIMDERGEYIGALAMITDITDRKKIERRLANSESRLKEAQAIAQIGSFEFDLEHHTDIWSDEIYNIYGIPKEENFPSKKLFLSFIHPDDVEAVEKILNGCFKTIERSIADFRFIRQDGTLRYGYCEVRAEFSREGGPGRIFGILQDISERKMAELERAKIVHDLTLKHRELEQFAYVISHNLRAPVVNIIGASNVLQEVELSIQDKEILNQGISQSGRQLDDIIQDLNLILQTKTEIKTVKEWVRFSDLVDGIQINSRKLIQSSAVTIRCDFSEINGFLTIKSYLYSIFYNLISNSIQYRRPEVACLIEISSRRTEDKIELIFADNGMGIDLQKNADDIFGLYKRFHTHTEGKGMGLFMVKASVEALGGKIGIESMEGVGTRFTIELYNN